MNKEKQIAEMARDIFEPRVAIDGIDIAFAAVHGADRDAEGHFMRIARHLYKKGYRKSEAFSQPHENGGEWISVKDRLPDINKLVLCWWTRANNDGQYGFATYQHHGVWYVSNEGMPTVTHWTPLPEPPQN